MRTQSGSFSASLLAETSALLDDREAAVSLYDRMLPWAHLNVADHPEGIRGSVSRYLGILATSLRRWADAELHFECALAMNARMDVRPWLGRAAHDYAEMLRARGTAADLECSAELSKQARSIYDALGIRG